MVALQFATGDALLEQLPDHLHDLPQRWAKDTPDRVALSDPLRSIRYGQLAVSIGAMADKLRQAGLRPGDRVGLVTENYVSAAVTLYAISACNAIVTPINARIAGPEIDKMMALLCPRFMIYVQDSDAALRHCSELETKRIDDQAAGSILMGPVNNDVEPDPLPAPAFIMFTSGTTGQPKGVMHAHSALLYQGASQASSRSVTPDDCLYIVAPLSHTIGFGSNLVTAAVAGAEARLAPRFDPKELAHSIATGQATFIVAVPQVYSKLLTYIDEQQLDISGHRLRFTGTGGATVDLTLIAKMEETFGLPFGNAYGCTEMTPITRVPDGVKAFGDAIGLPAPGCEVKIVTPSGALAKTDEVGEIWARGPSRMLGYYKNPQATHEVITQDGWLKTGDMGRMDANGHYYIAGRDKEMIIRSGFNVYPAEIETILNAFPGVMQSAVIGRAVEGDEEIIAFVQPLQGVAIDEDALRRHCRANLSGYKMPKRIAFQDLPSGPTGKILKSALKNISLD